VKIGTALPARPHQLKSGLLVPRLDESGMSSLANRIGAAWLHAVDLRRYLMNFSTCLVSVVSLVLMDWTCVR